MNLYKKSRAMLIATVVAQIANARTIPKQKLTDVYTKDEIQLICQVVETEMYTCDTQEKSYVASVVFNMIDDPEQRFGKSVKAVIKAKNRFYYSRKKISKTTRKAVEKAFEENTAPGCYAFHCMRKKKKFAGFTYRFTDKYGVHYYGEEEE
jgi:tRNA pseudouridine-54 N-methylase